jgi:hypothetical protein
LHPGTVTATLARGLPLRKIARRLTAKAAGAPTFLASPRKVGQRRRACEGARYAGTLRCSQRPAVKEGQPTALFDRHPRPPLRGSAPSKANPQGHLPYAASDAATLCFAVPIEDTAAVGCGSGAVPGACLSPWRGKAAIGRVSRPAR